MARGQLRASTIVYGPADLSVDVKNAWAGTWATVPYLRATRATKNAGPGIGQASFTYRYGRGQQADRRTKKNYYPCIYPGWFVRIRARFQGGHRRTLWTGIFQSESYSIQGETTTPSGVQTLTAYELGHLLDSRMLYFGHYKTYLDAVDTIRTLPRFNARERGSRGIIGNRSTLKASAWDGTEKNAYVFSDESSIWTNRDIAEYLLAYLPPESLGGPITLAGQSDLADNLTEVHDLEGLSLWEALNRLFPRRRGLGWTLDVSDDGTLAVRVFSLLGEDISTLNATITANPNRVQVVLDDERIIRSADVTIDRSAKFEKIVVLGEQAVSCFTVSYADANLCVGWTSGSADTEEYGYKYVTGLADKTDAYANDAERRKDEYERVYQYHRIPAGWDWKAGDGETGVEQTVIIPRINKEGSGSVPASYEAMMFGKTFLRQLPIEADAEVSGAEKEFKKPMGFIKEGGVWRNLESAESADGQFGAEIRMSDSDLGIWVKPPANHLLGLNSFDAVTSPETGGGLASNYDPIADYADLLFTVALRTDERLRVIGTTDDYLSAPAPKKLVLSAPGHEYWYLVPNTVVNVFDGVLAVDSGGLLRDDSDNLNKILALALAWYGVARGDLSMSWQAITDLVPLGTYIEDVSSSWMRRQVGTVVTEKSWNFADITSELKTDYTELDIGAMAGADLHVPGIGSGRVVGLEMQRLRKDIQSVEERIHNLPDRAMRTTGGAASSSGSFSHHSHNATTDGGAAVIDTDG